MQCTVMLSLAFRQQPGQDPSTQDRGGTQDKTLASANVLGPGPVLERGHYECACSDSLTPIDASF